MKKSRKRNRIFYEWDESDAVFISLIVAFAILVLFICKLPTSVSANESEIKDTYISEEYQEYCREVGEGLGICPELLMAIVEAESSGDPNAVSENGKCVGLTQVNPDVWSEMMADADISNAFDPHDNILLCGLIIKAYSKNETYGEDVAWVLMKYNGFSRADYYANNGWLTSYAEKILERSAELEKLHYGI